MGVYAADGSINVTIVDGLSVVGAYAPDGSWNVIESDGTVGSLRHPCGALRVTFVNGLSVVGQYAADGSLNVIESAGASPVGYYHPSGATNITIVDIVLAAESILVIDEMTASPSLSRQRAINNLVLDLIATGLWDKLDIFYMFAAHDQQAARLNWKSPTNFVCTDIAVPTFIVDRGFFGNAVDSGINTNWTALTDGVNYLLDSAHLGAVTLTSRAGLDWTLCSAAPANAYIIPLASDNNHYFVLNSATQHVIANGTSQGVYLTNRSGAAAQQSYKNGVSIGSSVAASTSVPGGVLVTHQLVGAGLFSADVCATLHAGGSLTPTEVASMHSILTDYYTELGFSVG